MPNKIMKYINNSTKYKDNFKEIDNKNQKNFVKINQNNNSLDHDDLSSSSSTESTSENDKIEGVEKLKNSTSRRHKERDLLIQKYGREKVRFHGNSTILLDSEKYKLKRQSNNEASKRSKKRKESKEKIGKFFINFMIHKLIDDKKKLKNEIDELTKEIEKLNWKNNILQNIVFNQMILN